MSYLFGQKLNIDWKISSVTIFSTILLIFDHYYAITAFKYLDRFLLYLIIPLMVILVIFGENPKEYGMSFGNWKLGLIYTAIGILALAPTLYYLVKGSVAMKIYYGGFVSGLPWTTFLDLVGWEFFFRGWILFAYIRKFGHDALWLQAVPFALAHINKPGIETFSTIFGGFAFGWVAYRTKSFIWPFLIHWFISTFVILVASGAV
jgi:membrane protease YdiL (CAAX protease family)